MHNQMTIYLPSASDQTVNRTVTIKTDQTIFWRDSYSVNLNRSFKDPIHQGLVKVFYSIFTGKKADKYHQLTSPFKDWPILLHVGSCPIYFEKKKNRYYVNSLAVALEIISNCLARLAYKAAFEEDAAKLLPFFYSMLELPEDVRYVIENRVPYHFYSEYQKHEVRLNVQQISDKECAIEIGDGLWGTISIKELAKFCGFYVHNKNRGKWPYTSPETLYTRLIGRKPKQSELKVMVAFLQQNRKQDIVEKRAKELVNSLLEQHSTRMKGTFSAKGNIQEMYIRGNGYDWKLQANGSTGTQQVSTFVWQPRNEDEPADWLGSICIDNMVNGSSLGDQFAARALSFLNDNITIKMVGTVKRYIVTEPNECRWSGFDAMR